MNPRASTLAAALLAGIGIQAGIGIPALQARVEAFTPRPEPAVRVFDPASVHFARLDNGLRVVVRQDRSASVAAVNVIIRAGPRRESPRNAGVTHFLEHMIFRAARADGRDLLGGPIEAAGGVVTAGTLRDFSAFRAVTASAHLDLALSTLAEALINPSFDNTAVFSERLVIMHEIRQLADDPQVAIWDMAFALAFGDHPYGRPIGGTDTSLIAISPGVLADFHRRWYAPDHASVVVVGDVKPEVALAAVERAFGKWKPSGATAVEAIPDPRLPPEPRELTEERDLPRAVVLMGFVAPGMSSPREVCAMDLLLTALGEGYTSRLKRALVDTEAADQVSANFLTQAMPGLFGISVTCAPARVGEVRRMLEAEARRLGAEPLGDAEMTTALRLLTRSYAFANETAQDQAETLGFYEAIATYEFALTYLQQVHSLTADEVRQAARRHLDPARCVWIVLRPAQSAGAAGAGEERR